MLLRSREKRMDANPLAAFFESHTTGHGIWKWRHYFEAYHRHLAHLRGKPNLTLLEIGVYSGGSLEMWREYFGPDATIFGVDIQGSCISYEGPMTHILIGDQEDPAFWGRLIHDDQLMTFDAIIDDGGHRPNQQWVSLDCLLPRIKPGGVYICEDVHRAGNEFAAKVYTIADKLNGTEGCTVDEGNPERRMVVPANDTQCFIHSVHLYPFLVAIEVRERDATEFVAPKHGTEWQPYLK